MSSAEERWMRANGLRHHVLVWNEEGSPTVVLCHGFLDMAWSFERLARPLAAAGLRVVAFDWRGHGQTEHVGAGGYYHFPDYVLDLHELMPFLAASPVHLLGHSMGGTAACLYAATHPSVPQTLTLVEGLGPPGFRGEAPDKMRTWLDTVERLRRRPPRPLTDLSEAVQRLRGQNPELPVDLAYELAERATTEAPDAEGLVWRFDPLHRTTAPAPFDPETFRAYLTRIECPALVVSGSRGFRTEDHDARVAQLRDARSVEIPDVGHMIHWLAPDALARALLAFLDERR